MQGLVTVFGGSGFIGSQVVRVLAKRGWRVRAAVRTPHLAHELRPMGDVGQIQVVRAHVGAPDTVAAALEGAQACVNLVGILHESGKRKFQTVHVEGARNVAQACAAEGIGRLIQISAIGADPNARSVYARTKGDGEDVCRRAVPSTTVLRPSIVFGPGDGFFNRFASMAAYSPVLPLPGGGKTRFQPVYVGDVAGAVLNCLEDPATAGGTFELGGPDVYSFRELMQIVLRETGKPRVLLPIPAAAARAAGTFGDIQAFFGLSPIITSDQALLMERDNVCGSALPGLEALGVRPTSVEAIVPTYLWRYRKGGQFAQAQPA